MMISYRVLLAIGLISITIVNCQNAIRCNITPGQTGHCVQQSRCPSVMIKDQREIQSLRCSLKDSSQGVCCHPDKIFELPFSTCGYSNDPRKHLTRAKPFEIPWMALLIYRDAKSNRLVEGQCYGALISDQYVLTSAACLQGSSKLKLEAVRLGEHTKSTVRDCFIDQGGREECSESQQIPVESSIIHKSHNSGSDIGLIRLSKKITFSNDVRAVCLPVQQTDKPFATRFFELSGWHGSSDVLRKEYPARMEPIECQSQLNDLGKSGVTIDSNKHFCSYRTDGTCSIGDSGSPLIQAADMGKYDIRMVLFGIHSLDASKCNAKVPINGPIVSMDVEKYLPWILDNMKA